MKSASYSPTLDGTSYGRRREALFRRFESTIPYGRLVTVDYGDHRNSALGAPLTVTGRPFKNLADVIWLKVWTHLVGIPKSMVRDIKGVHVDMVEELPTPSGNGEPLNPADPKFQRFDTAILFEERVRVTYREKIRHDPATASLGRYLTTVVEGQASQLDGTWLHIIPTMENGAPVSLANDEGTAVKRQLPGMEMLKRAIPRGDILDLVFMGPRQVDPADMR